MDWQNTGSIFLVLGVFAVVVGGLLRFKVGRWLLATLWLLLTLGSLLSGDLHALTDGSPDVDGDPHRISRYWLIGGGICLLLGWVFRMLATHSI
jgi:hypothetical protein